MGLAKFISAESVQIISEWEKFAGDCFPGMELEQRRDHIVGMLEAIVRDLATPQTTHEQAEKSKGRDDAHVDSKTAANSHGTDRAATGYTPVQMVSEFRALRASILRLWAEAQNEFNRANIEELTRFNEAIDQLLAESIARYAQDVDHSKDVFLGILGHDLRNPLGAIMMSATVMMRKERPDWPHLKTVARIVTSGMRMDAMIGDLVDFTRSRLGAGIPIVRADVDMELIARSAVDEITAFHPGCVVEFEASGELHGSWDAARIGQALSNLVGNAEQHGAQDAPVKVVVRGDPECVVITVHNHGPVIAKSAMGEMFSPFRQLAPGRAKPRDGRSLGLGLYIAQSIVSAHQGTINVESTASGTTFTVRLPTYARVAEAARA